MSSTDCDVLLGSLLFLQCQYHHIKLFVNYLLTNLLFLSAAPSLATLIVLITLVVLVTLVTLVTLLTVVTLVTPPAALAGLLESLAMSLTLVVMVTGRLAVVVTVVVS